MVFCANRIAVDPKLVPDSGLLRAKDINISADAIYVAEKIREEAIADARQIARNAKENADAVVQKAERDTLLKACTLIKRLQHQNEIFLQCSESMFFKLLIAALDHLLVEISPHEKIISCIKRIASEAPPYLVNATLYVHPSDIDMLPEINWEIKPDPALEVGSCRLEAVSGEWHADFAAATLAVRKAFAIIESRDRSNNSIDD
jgi:flagellar biosynthesis/type III secretory pathway protein FliH